MKIKLVLSFSFLSVVVFSQDRSYELTHTSGKNNSYLLGSGFLNYLQKGNSDKALTHIDPSLHFTIDSLSRIKMLLEQSLPKDFKVGHGFIDWDSLPGKPYHEVTFYRWNSKKAIYYSQIKLYFTSEGSNAKINKIIILDAKKLIKHDKAILKREEKNKNEPSDPPPPPPPSKK